MNIEINTANVLKIIGTLVMLGGLLWGLSEKFNKLEAYAKVNEAKVNMLLEERMARMERTELYNRMNEVLNKGVPSSEENYSIERYMPKNDYKQEPASKK